MDKTKNRVTYALTKVPPGGIPVLNISFEHAYFLTEIPASGIDWRLVIIEDWIYEHIYTRPTTTN